MVKPSKYSPSNEDPVDVEFITLEQILVIHEDQVDRYGGSQGIRDLALLESAVYRPQATFGGNDLYPAIFDKAAVLMHSLILNHPFIDGNKRSGMVSAFVFLELNGLINKIKINEVISVAMKIESKEMKIEAISKWLEKYSKRLRK